MIPRSWNAIAVVAVMVLGACATRGQVLALEERTAALDEKLQAQSERDELILKRLDNLKGLLDREGGALRDHGASMLSRLDALELDLRKLKGRDEELTFANEQLRGRLAALSEVLDDRFGLSSEPLPEELPKNPRGLFAAAADRMQRGLDRVGRAIFRRIIRKYPKSREAPKAWLRIGESYAREGNIEAAFRELVDMEQVYGDKPEMVEAFLLVGQVLDRNGQCSRAIAVFEAFLGRAPKHKRRVEIEQKIKVLKARPGCGGS